jgi:hypothetical protein
MPHQGTQITFWILMCLGLVLIWIVTFLVVRAVTGGPNDNASTGGDSMLGGNATAHGAEPTVRHLDNTLTSPERDSYRRPG